MMRGKTIMTKKYKFSIEEILESLSNLDLYCCWYDILRPKKHIIAFGNDPKGNVNGPCKEIVLPKKKRK